MSLSCPTISNIFICRQVSCQQAIQSTGGPLPSRQFSFLAPLCDNHVSLFHFQRQFKKPFYAESIRSPRFIVFLRIVTLHKLLLDAQIVVLTPFLLPSSGAQMPNLKSTCFHMYNNNSLRKISSYFY